MVRDGDYVNVGQPLMTVTRNRRLYLRAEVAERDYAILNKITSAKFKMSYSDKVYDLNELDGHFAVLWENSRKHIDIYSCYIRIGRTVAVSYREHLPKYIF